MLFQGRAFPDVLHALSCAVSTPPWSLPRSFSLVPLPHPSSRCEAPPTEPQPLTFASSTTPTPLPFPTLREVVCTYALAHLPSQSPGRHSPSFEPAKSHFRRPCEGYYMRLTQAGRSATRYGELLVSCILWRLTRAARWLVMRRDDPIRML